MNRKYTEKILKRIRNDYYRRMDAKDDEGRWVTTEKGRHVHFNEGGEVDKGNPHVVASMAKGGAKVSKSIDRSEDFSKAYKALGEAMASASSKKSRQEPRENRFGTGKAAGENYRRLRQTEEHLKNGGSIDKNGNLVTYQLSGAESQNGAKGRSEVTSGGKRPMKEMGAETIFANHPNLNESKSGYISKENASKVGNVKGGRGKDFTAKSDTSRLIDTSDAMKELKSGTINSLAEYMDKDGNLSPERQKLHDEIVENYFKDKVKFNGQPTMIMSGGGPASGKSFVTKGAVSKFKGDESLVKIDPDEIKQMLPGFEDMAKNYYEEGANESKALNAAAYYHEESSALAKRIYQYALENGMNVVYDGTGDGSVNSVRKKIQAARDVGCKVEGEYVTINNDEAVKRNRGRYEHGVEEYEKAKSNGGFNEKGEKVPAPRLVPDDVVLGTHQKVTDISVEVAKMFDKYTLFDNNGKAGEQVAIAECVGDGKLKAIKGQEKRLQAFLDKGLGKYRIAEDGTVETIESADEVRNRASKKS